MKILVISLLRLGDIILSTPVLQGLKEKYPDGEIHLLMNKQFENIAGLIPYVDNFHMFDRANLQHSIASYKSSIFEPLDEVESLIENLNNESYDLIINLTQNKLSGWLSGIVAADEKKGLIIEAGTGHSFGSPWFRYMNDYVAANGRDPFHFIDIFYYGSELSFKKHNIELQETETGKSEADKILKGLASFICIQPFTSDEKKDWGEDKFIEALKIFNALNPGHDVVLLGAPFEKKKIEQLHQKCLSHNIKAVIGVCSLEAALSILVRAKMLLTGDTSIKHLACSTDCKIIEMSLGSSNYRKTGVYKPGSYIIQSEEPCAPCRHAKSCDKDAHYCADRISAESVGLIMSKVLSNNITEIKLLAKEYANELSIYRTYFNHSGFWLAQNLNKEFSDQLLQDWISRSSLKLLFQEEHKKLIGEYGAESIKVKAALTELFPEVNNTEVISTINRVVEKSQKYEMQLNKLQLKFRNFIAKGAHIDEYQDLKIGLSSLEFIDESPSVEEIVCAEGLSLHKDFSKVRKIQTEIKDVYLKNQIKIKLLRTLKSQLVEIL